MAKTNISPKDVARIADLARLELDAQSLECYADQLRQILKYVASVHEVTDQTGGDDNATTPHHELKNISREDGVADDNVGTEELLRNTPSQTGDMISVPIILGEKV
jgi:aspartyl-tRNA(Asn)/glutamyl-tRNA(Gln) amidotransferase subunit C